MTDHAELKRLAEAATTWTDGGVWKHDSCGVRQIWAKSLKGGDTHVADVRGWGYFTGGGHGALGLTDEKGIEAQGQIGKFIAAANPATILSLLDELEASKRLLREIVDLTSLCTTPERFGEAGTGDVFSRMVSLNARARGFLDRERLA